MQILTRAEYLRLMNNKTEIVSNTVAGAGAGLTGVSWLWNWLGTNHDSITAICAIMGAIGMISGIAVNIWHKRKIQKYVKKRGSDYETM